jgi:hypothetical protein
VISSKLAHLALCVAAAAYVLLVPVRAQAEEVGPASPSNGIVVGTDHRVPISPDTWPWTSIGRLNVIEGLRAKYCTGTLIGRRPPATIFNIHLVLGYVPWLLCFGAYVWAQRNGAARIDQVPDGVRLVAGMTATVQIDPRPKSSGTVNSLRTR